MGRYPVAYRGGTQAYGGALRPGLSAGAVPWSFAPETPDFSQAVEGVTDLLRRLGALGSPRPRRPEFGSGAIEAFSIYIDA